MGFINLRSANSNLVNYSADHSLSHGNQEAFSWSEVVPCEAAS